MPKSKRNKVISLTKVQKKGKEMKQELVTKVQTALAAYDRVFVLSVENLKTHPFKKLKHEWKEDSK